MVAEVHIVDTVLRLVVSVVLHRLAVVQVLEDFLVEEEVPDEDELEINQNFYEEYKISSHQSSNMKSSPNMTSRTSVCCEAGLSAGGRM